MHKRKITNLDAPAISPTTDGWLGTNPAAKYLGTSVPTLRRWIKAGYLKPRRTPTGELRFKRADLDKLLS